MDGKLKIYACSGIGSNDEQERLDYWMDNTVTTSNTRAVNTLLAKINLAYTEYLYLNLSDTEQLERLNKIDLLSLCLFYAQQYSNDSEKLHNAGQVIGYISTLPTFQSMSTDNAQRDEHLDSLFNLADEMMGEDVKAPEQFTAFWTNVVENGNIVGLSAEQQKASAAFWDKQSQKIGAVDYSANADLSRYLNDAGTYFLYTFYTDEQLKQLPAVFRRKRKTQLKVYEYCKNSFVGIYGSEQDMKDIIRSGIIKDFGDTPENVCATRLNNGIGALGVDDIITILTIVVSFIVSVITAICQYAAQVKVAEFSRIDEQAARENAPAPDDYDDLQFGQESSISNILPFIGIGLVAYLLLKD